MASWLYKGPAGHTYKPGYSYLVLSGPAQAQLSMHVAGWPPSQHEFADELSSEFLSEFLKIKFTFESEKKWVNILCG